MPRATSVSEVIAALPTYFQPDQASGIRGVVQLDIGGQGGGQWYLTIAAGQLDIAPGQAPGPNVTLAADAADYLDMANGEANPLTLFMQGKLKIRGDVQLALRMQSLFKAPR